MTKIKTARASAKHFRRHTDDTYRDRSECIGGKARPKVEVMDSGLPSLFAKDDKDQIEVHTSRAKKLLGLERLRSPKQSIREIVKPGAC